mmetsp:Transcript_16065/g.26155  ORF Transcript_16065/g.26155 Transcript_16065/m.26155 type:complete len:471 (+) Transcript_16065:329-1741(+)
MVVRYLPLAILPYINKGISARDLITRGSHGELINPCVLAPIVADGDVAFQDFTLWLLLQEPNEVITNQVIISPWHIRHGRKKHCLGCIPLGHRIGILGSQGRIPKLEQVLDLLFGNGLGLVTLGHDGTVVLRYFPLAVFKDVDEGVASLDLGTVGTQGELVNSSILGPVGTNNNISALNLTLRLRLQKVGEVVDNTGVIRPGHITHSGQQDTCLGVSIGNLFGILGGQCIVPQVEQSTNLLLGYRFGSDDTLGHDTAVVVVDLPFAVFVDVDEGVASRDLLARCAQSKLIKTHIRSCVLTDSHMTFQNLTLRLRLQKVNEIILNTRKVRPWCITDRGQQHTILGITGGNLLWILGRQGIVPKAKEGTDLGFGDGFAHGDFLGHDGGVVVLNLPDAVLFDVVVGVAGLDDVTSGAHGELINTTIGRPSIANVDIAIENFAQRLLEEEGVEVVLHRGKVRAWLVRDGGKEDW